MCVSKRPARCPISIPSRNAVIDDIVGSRPENLASFAKSEVLSIISVSLSSGSKHYGSPPGGPVPD